MKMALIIPTRNAGSRWADCLAAIQMQTRQPDWVLVIDSASQDTTVAQARAHGFSVLPIAAQDFNHGGTRNLGAQQFPDADVFVYLTQDAVLADPNSLAHILQPFADEQVAAVCARQLPHQDANPIASHARLFNYPAKTRYKTLADVVDLKIKAAFMSNSFSAYRASAFGSVGGFPDNTILGEDMFVAAKLLLAGRTVVYSADAQAYHSHNYTVYQEFCRYFDIGVFHACEPWIQSQLGGAAGEGKKFVLSESRYLGRHAPWYLPKAWLMTLAKLSGYKLGKNFNRLPRSWCQKISMCRSYWH